MELPADRTDLDQKAVITILKDSLAGSLRGIRPHRVTNTRRQAQYLPKDIEQRIKAGMREAGWTGTFGEFASSVLIRALESPVPTAKPNGDNERDNLQKAMRAVAWDAYRDGSIAMIEGGTGVGKSRVIAQVAIEMVREQRKRVVCMAPTIAAMQHQVAEIREVDADMPISILLGRGQFVDAEALRDFCAKEACPEVVKKWVKNNGPCMSPASIRLNDQACHGKLRWLMDDLHFVAPPDFPCTNFQSEGSKLSGENAIYEQLNEWAMTGGIIIASMARVFTHVLGRSSSGFPEEGWDYLIADEAHELGSAAANQLGSAICVSTLLRFLGRDSDWTAYRLGTTVAKAREAIIALGNSFRNSPEGIIGTSNLQTVRLQVQIAHAALSKISKKADGAKDPGLQSRIRQIRRHQTALGALRKIISGEIRDVAVLSKSPVRKFPSIETGPRSVHWLLRKLWDITPAGAMFSGTLYARLKTGKYSCQHMALSVLGIPKERILSCPQPFTPAWLTESPTIMRPKEADWEKFRYASEEEFIGPWREDVAKVIRKAFATSKGGILVLVPSYADSAGLAEILRRSGRYCIIEQTAQTGVRHCLDEFREMGRIGKRPIWLGSGGAWTGVNVSAADLPPEEDLLLTDLIIPRIPFNLQRGSTYECRRLAMGPGVDTLDAYFLLRQGFGRLIRRKGLPSRRIWFLDTRPEFNRGNQTTFKNFLELYPRQELFGI